MQPTPLPSPIQVYAPDFARRFALIMTALAALIARRFLRDPRFVALINPLWKRFTRAARRCERLMALLAAGRLPPPDAPGAPSSASPYAQPSASPARRGGPHPNADALPRGKGWLIRVLGYEAAGYASQLQALLTEPGAAELLALAPTAGRIFRPLTRLLTIGAFTFRSRPARAAPVAAPPPLGEVVGRSPGFTWYVVPAQRARPAPLPRRLSPPPRAVSLPPMPPDPRPLYIASEAYRRPAYAPKHPLSVPRVAATTDLIRAMGWLPPAAVLEAPMATGADIARFHDPLYLAALQRTEAAGRVAPEDRARYRIGADGNPVFRDLYSRAAISAGGALLAARLTAAGGVVHCPAGGAHHGRPDRASGFCYVNTPVLLLLAWLDAGLQSIVYLDIDAHHGDAVQDAFHDDPRVFTISIHEAGRWPFTGAAADRAGGAARNFPVPRGLHDAEMRHLMRHAVLPLIRARRPQAILLQSGADALEEDPLARLSLSNNAYLEVAAALPGLAPGLVVVGGGGYNPYAVARCWAGIWAVLNDFAIPPRTTAEAEAVLRALTYNRAAGRDPPEHWFTTLRDAPREGAVRDDIKRLAEQALKEGLPA